MAGGEWIGSTGPSLVGQPLSLMRCEEVSLIPGGVPHGAVLLLLQEPPSVLLQTSAPGPSLVAVADDHGFILWPPATAAESGLLSHVGSLSRLPASSPVATAALTFCILHRRSLGSGLEAVMFMAGVRHLFISVPVWPLLLCPGHLESARP